MSGERASLFSLLVALCSLLLTAVVAQSLWESYYPDRGAESLRRRREHYEKVLLPAGLSWEEALYYKVVDSTPKKR